MSGISLTASMRSNLLSLQNIASRQDIVQNRLATGLKVSSAIDNPSSYYTASSLNNRAADLTALLDAMSQGIQTIKAVSEAIDSGTKFLEQAKAVASSALETAIPAKEWFVKQVGTNGIVVETAQELLDAVNAGKETIVVYGKIELQDTTITLKDNQKLVGVGYYGNFDSLTDKFSQIISHDTTLNVLSAIKLGNNSLLSDLTITHSSNFLSGNGTVTAKDINGAVIQDMDITFSFGENADERNNTAAITTNNSQIRLAGNINLNSDKHGMYTIQNSSVTINGNIKINSAEISIYSTSSITNLEGKLTSKSKYSCFNLRDSSSLTVKTGSDLFLSGYFLTSSSSPGLNSQITFEDNVKTFCSANAFFIAQENIDIHFARNVQFSNLTQSWISTTASDLHLNNGENYRNFNNNPAFSSTNLILPQTNPDATIYSPQQKQYSNILLQYNTLIADSFYKGISLLNGQNLKINFNEDRSSKIDVAGVKADSDSLGLKTKEWNSSEDIEQSVSELEDAINSLRGFASQFGNYYSIVTTRQDFTENLINVLEEGADKLTLADMNQESANMLALQTSQQLAVNSLSLASQASQSILRLF